MRCSVKASAFVMLTAALAAAAVPASAAVAGPENAARPNAAAGAMLTATQAKINVNSAEWFRYSGTHLPAGSVAYLLRQSGNSWKQVARLGAHASGTTSLKLVSQGTDRFRVQYREGSRAVATSTTASVTVLPPAKLSLAGVTTSISIGRSPVFRYIAQNLASGDSVALQRQFGTSGVWKTVMALAASGGGTVIAPKLPTLGKYEYRTVIIRGGKAVKSSGNVIVRAYEAIPLSPLCDFGCSGTVQVGSQVFSYTDEAWADSYPQYSQNEAFPNGTSCRSLSVKFAGGQDEQANSEESYLEFLQTTEDAQYASVPPGQVATTVVTLDGGPLYIDSSIVDNGEIGAVVMNITGSCYTASGTR